MKLRRATDEDKPWINTIIAKEASHNHTADFYFEPGTEAWIVDDDGKALLIFRLNTKLVRVDIDFDPEQRLRTAKALAAYFPVVKDAAKKKGLTQMIFDSNSETLIRFCGDHFGFRANPDYVAVL